MEQFDPTNKEKEEKKEETQESPKLEDKPKEKSILTDEEMEELYKKDPDDFMRGQL